MVAQMFFNKTALIIKASCNCMRMKAWKNTFPSNNIIHKIPMKEKLTMNLIQGHQFNN